MIFEELVDALKAKISSIEVLEDNILLVPRVELLPLVTHLYETEGLYFDQLACITGFHNQPKEETYEVVYSFYSIPYEHSLTIKIKLENEQETIPSLTSIYKGADWLEREVFDLFGIKFENHPDLRRILLPANWEGYPLRKDYKTQEYYHGIKVDY